MEGESQSLVFSITISLLSAYLQENDKRILKLGKYMYVMSTLTGPGALKEILSNTLNLIKWSLIFLSLLSFPFYILMGTFLSSQFSIFYFYGNFATSYTHTHAHRVFACVCVHFCDVVKFSYFVMIIDIFSIVTVHKRHCIFCYQRSVFPHFNRSGLSICSCIVVFLLHYIQFVQCAYICMYTWAAVWVVCVCMSLCNLSSGMMQLQS